MGMSQGYSVCSYLKQTKNIIFSFTKLENRRAKQVLPRVWWGVVNSGRGEEMRKGHGRVNIVQIL
jgi:hypothetical protein